MSDGTMHHADRTGARFPITARVYGQSWMLMRAKARLTNAA
jgi:hypothetical protein